METVRVRSVPYPLARPLWGPAIRALEQQGFDRVQALWILMAATTRFVKVKRPKNA